MKVLILTLVAGVVSTSLAGQAFPQASQNYVISLFQGVNANIEWDRTNYLVDLSGPQAQCQFAQGSGTQYERRRDNPDEFITVIQDSGNGRETHVEAVNSYIRQIMATWPQRYANHIRKANTFGCSVQSGCSGRISIACLFTPSIQNDQGDRPGTTDNSRRIGTTTAPAATTASVNSGNWKKNPRARAFTPEQYTLAEEITGTTWDRSNVSEIISAYDISCRSMVLSGSGTDRKARIKAAERGLTVTGVYGVNPNKGDTETALIAILKEMDKPDRAVKVGCSLIADCMKEGQMYVVANCVFQL